MDAKYLGVGVATYDSPHYAPVIDAVSHARGLGSYLTALGFEAECLNSATDAEVKGRLATFWAGGEVVILYWTGHGAAPDQHDLRLIARNSSELARRNETCDPASLVEDALAAGARQILILLDTCYSGAAMVAVTEAAAQYASARSSVDGGGWVGVVASCQSYEKAVAGRFAEALLKLLRDGPSTPAFRIHWSAQNEGLRGNDLLEALWEEWPYEFQKPWVTTFGWPKPMLPNPKRDPQAPDRLVEHLARSARGTAPGEDGWYFTGRHRVLGEIVDWLSTGRAGLCVVTGPGGSGKSAVVGRIAALSDSRERADLVVAAALVADDHDPGEGSVDAVLYARGQSHDTLLAELARKLGARGAVSVYGVLDHLVRQDSFPTVIVDALDEAQTADLTRIAKDLLIPLSSRAQILVGTRPRPVTTGRTLVDLLAGAGVVLDLSSEPDTAEDIERYVVRRLADTGNRAIAEIAAEVAKRADGPQGGFLYARMVTSRLREESLDTAVTGWADALDAGVAAALDRDLKLLPTGPRRTAQAALDLLTALAWSYGKGLPARDVWPAMASGLVVDDQPGSYTEADVEWVLGAFGGYIVEGGESGQAVYRLFHQQLVERLCRDQEQGLRIDRAAEALLTRQSGADSDLTGANPYLQTYARAHRLRGSDAHVALAHLRFDADPERSPRGSGPPTVQRSAACLLSSVPPAWTAGREPGGGGHVPQHPGAQTTKMTFHHGPATCIAGRGHDDGGVT